MGKPGTGKTEFVYVQGKGKWIKIINPDPIYNKWSITLYPTPDSLEKIRELQAEGIKNVVKKDEDGYHVNFSRPAWRTIRGKNINLTPPEVFEADGTTPMRDLLIGNGSDLTVKLEVYQHGTPSGGSAKAARLLSLRVDNLVPVHQQKDETQARAAKGLAEQPEQLF